jgi:tRNA(Ile)-lysidine synthase
MAALPASVAAVRVAVRRALAAIGPADPAGPAVPAGPDAPADRTVPADRTAPAGPRLALVACSGGADSLALAAATAFVAPRVGWRAGLLTIDHRLQPGSADRAEAVAAWATHAGFHPVRVLPVTVTGRPGGPEAAARAARYEALAEVGRQLGAVAVLLGHTLDDQAETVLLALARGAGPRGLAGMPPQRRSGGLHWLRPLLGVRREQTRAACAAQQLTAWEDPHNADPAYARARVRATALPALVEALGDRVVTNLAQTARQLAADTAALDTLAEAALVAAGTPGGGLSVAALQAQPAAVRTRVLHAWARRAGVPGSALSHRHVAALDALVTDWRGQGPVHLPGDRRVSRRRVAAEPELTFVPPG